MSLAIEHLKPRIAGFNVIDCEIKNRDVLYLLAREDYTQRPGWNESSDPPPEKSLAKRLIGIGLQLPDDKKFPVTHLTGMGRSLCGVAFQPEEKVVVIDSSSKAWSPAAGSSGMESPMATVAEGGLKRGGFSKVKSFGGRLFACTTARQVFVRHSPGVWEAVGEEMPEPDDHVLSFVDFDGFRADDLYAVGDPGDLWRLSSGRWNKLHFPSDCGISAVCCGGDGQVYLAAGNHVFRGWDDQWVQLKTTVQMSIPIKDMVWCDGQLLATSDHGLWTLKDDALVEADAPPGIKVCAGNLAQRDGVLLLAGYGGAAFKREGQWTEIFHDHEVREWFHTHRDQVWTPPR